MHAPRVLVVDDDFAQRGMLLRLLSGHRFEPAQASSAPEAVELIRGFHPDLIIVDVAMPGVNGIKFVNILRSAPETTTIPVILMTGLTMPGDAVEAMARGIGVGPIFVKGGDVLELVQRIRTILSPVRGERPVAPGALRRGALFVDPDNHKAWFDGQPLPLHARSLFDLLCAFMRHSEPLSREALRQLLWSRSDSSGIVYVSIQRLRKALRAYPAIRIEATGTGYLLSVRAPAKADFSIAAPSKNNP